MLVRVFLGFRNDSPNLGGPENSLHRWRDQGAPELLADYGCAWTFFLYVADRYGHDFMQAFHLNSEARNIAGFDAHLASEGETETFIDLLPIWQAALMTAGQINIGSALESSSYSVEDLEFMTLPLSKVNWTAPQAYSSPGAPTNGADFVRLRDASGAYLAARQIDSLQFMGATTYATVSAFRPRGAAIVTVPGNSINSVIERQFDLSGGGQIAIDLQWGLEPYYDFFVVQVYDEEIGDYVSLASEYTTTLAENTFGDYLPGITNSSAGVVTATYDASAFASQGQVKVALRVLTDEEVISPGVRFFGMSVDGVNIADATNFTTWTVVEDPVYAWSVVLVSFTEDDKIVPVYINDLPLTDDYTASLNKQQVEALTGTKGDFVGVKVAAVDPTGRIEVYADYTLMVNGFVQPGGS